MKNRKQVKKIAGWVTGGIAVGGLFISMLCYIQLRRNERQIENYAVCVMDLDSGITWKDVNDALSKEKYYQGGYCIMQGQSIYAKDTKRNAAVDVIISDSSLENIIQTEGALLKEDAYGCILSSESMYRLFGTMKVNGQKVELQGEAYYVRGIVWSDADWMIVRYSDRNMQEVSGISGIVMDVDEESYHNQYGEDIGNRLQCSDKDDVYYVSDYTTFFGKMDMPKTGTELFDYTKWKQKCKDTFYRKIYKNKDIIERYFYHITWEHIRWLGVIGFCMFISMIWIIWRKRS